MKVAQLRGVKFRDGERGHVVVSFGGDNYDNAYRALRDVSLWLGFAWEVGGEANIDSYLATSMVEGAGIFERATY